MPSRLPGDVDRGPPVRPDAAFQVALARAYLGRANAETRRDVAGGLAAVRTARAALAAAADATSASTVCEINDWLAAHGH